MLPVDTAPTEYPVMVTVVLAPDASEAPLGVGVPHVTLPVDWHEKSSHTAWEYMFSTVNVAVCPAVFGARVTDVG